MTAGRPRWPRQLRALLLKDLRLELRTRDTAVAMVLFAVLAMLIFQFAFGNRGDDLTPYAGGILWATLSLTVCIPVIKRSMRSSMTFRPSERRSNSSPLPLTGMRRDKSPSLI